MSIETSLQLLSCLYSEQSIIITIKSSNVFNIITTINNVITNTDFYHSEPKGLIERFSKPFRIEYCGCDGLNNMCIKGFELTDCVKLEPEYQCIRFENGMIKKRSRNESEDNCFIIDKETNHFSINCIFTGIEIPNRNHMTSIVHLNEILKKAYEDMKDKIFGQYLILTDIELFKLCEDILFLMGNYLYLLTKY